MASVASDGGGVGPHVDSSDVFLLQASGRRRWSVQLEYVDEAAQSDAAGVCRTLPDFKADAAWVLEPGDLLYVPPFIPHEGVAFGGAEVCSTLSFGLRTYDSKQLAARWVEDELLGGTAALVDAPLDWRRGDGGRRRRRCCEGRRPGRVAGRVGRRRRVRRFLGALVTEPRAPPVADDEDDDCWRDAVAEAAGGVRVEAFDAADAVCRGPGARLARVGATLLCAGGVCREVPADVASLRLLSVLMRFLWRTLPHVRGGQQGARGGGGPGFCGFLRPDPPGDYS